MRLIPALLCSIILATSCKTNSSIIPCENGIIFQTIFIGNNLRICPDSSARYFLINSKLVNHTDKEFEFVAYSCATASSIVINHDCIKPCVSACSNNYPTVIRLEPNQEFRMPVVLKISNCDLSYNDSLRIGIVLINPTRLNDISDFGTMLNKSRTNFENVLWSEPLNNGDKPSEIRTTNNNIEN
jgi:hypothetical protein